MSIKLGDVVLIALSTSVMSGTTKSYTIELRSGAERKTWKIHSWDLDGEHGEVELGEESILVLDDATPETLKAFIETTTDTARARQQASFLKEDIPS